MCLLLHNRKCSDYDNVISKMVDTRKRSREEDDVCESTPLSKRINNLHLTNFEETQRQLIKDTRLTNDEILLTDSTVQVSNKEEAQQAPGGSMGAVVEVDTEHHPYNPELSESQNPFYFAQNKLLHDLYLERIKRCAV